jgi:hypothetical protein
MFYFWRFKSAGNSLQIVKEIMLSLNWGIFDEFITKRRFWNPRFFKNDRLVLQCEILIRPKKGWPEFRQQNIESFFLCSILLESIYQNYDSNRLSPFRTTIDIVRK